MCDWIENQGLEQAILRRSRIRFARSYPGEEKILSVTVTPDLTVEVF